VTVLKYYNVCLDVLITMSIAYYNACLNLVVTVCLKILQCMSKSCCDSVF
jgi:hypothetical protein